MVYYKIPRKLRQKHADIKVKLERVFLEYLWHFNSAWLKMGHVLDKKANQDFYGYKIHFEPQSFHMIKSP